MFRAAESLRTVIDRGGVDRFSGGAQSRDFG
jgi:hypothetical protein